MANDVMLVESYPPEFSGVAKLLTERGLTFVDARSVDEAIDNVRLRPTWKLVIVGKDFLIGYLGALLSELRVLLGDSSPFVVVLTSIAGDQELDCLLTTMPRALSIPLHQDHYNPAEHLTKIVALLSQMGLFGRYTPAT